MKTKFLMDQKLVIFNKTTIPTEFINRLTNAIWIKHTGKLLTVKIVHKDSLEGNTMICHGWYQPFFHKVQVTIPKFTTYPNPIIQRCEHPYRQIVVNDQIEYLTRLLAHEMRHAWQRDNCSFWIDHIEREIDAEDYSECILRKLRNGTLLRRK